ncbi:MAG: GNAT family N-acetyltransferase [Terriglobia bacterium]|nr:GNAT family N-acetyltransferase [Terriglobia bacterium]
MSFTVYRTDPIKDPRWGEFISRHPNASIFHSPQWLCALQRTYSFQPIVFTTSPPGYPLSNGIVFASLSSWMMGKRLVSMPFSDFCEPLVNNPDELAGILDGVCRIAPDVKYVELRPTSDILVRSAAFAPVQQFYVHSIDLKPSLGELLAACDKRCIQQRIKRAEREQLTYKEGRSEADLASFYTLMILTRQRHQLPPQPFEWFRNLLNAVHDDLTIHLVSKGDRSIAGLLTLKFGATLYCKYSCSDHDYCNLAGGQLVFWNAICSAKAAGLSRFDFGRTEKDNTGLITFRLRWGAKQREIQYWRNPPLPIATDTGWKMTVAKEVFSHLPGPLLQAAGRLLYRHFA